MDSAVLLDLLGNENRRRILRLLATKPCYVTEISEYLDVSPKAVIDHLRKLDEAGLVESTTDDQRRKYFRIAQSLRLEVSVSPYGFGAKSAYPAKNSFDMASRCQHLSIEIPDDSGSSSDLADLAGEYGRLQDLDANSRWPSGGYKGASRTPWRRSTNVSAPSRTAAFSRRCSTRWSRPTAHPRRSPTRSAPARRRWRTPLHQLADVGSSPARRLR